MTYAEPELSFGPPCSSVSSCRGWCSGETVMGLILSEVLHALMHMDAPPLLRRRASSTDSDGARFPRLSRHRLNCHVSLRSEGDSIEVYTFVLLHNETHCTMNCITNILLFSCYWYIYILVYMCICLNHVIILVVFITQYIMRVIVRFSQVFLSEKHFFDKCKKKRKKNSVYRVRSFFSFQNKIRKYKGDRQ